MASTRRSVAAIFLILLLEISGQAETIYQYTDANGTTVFTDNPAEVPSNQRQKAQERSIEFKASEPKVAPAAPKAAPVAAPPPIATKPSATPKAATQASARPDITLYVTSWCGYCRKLKTHLRERGYSYTEKDIEKDSSAGREFAERFGRSGVPVMVIGDKVLKGYNPTHVDEILAQFK